MKRTLIIIFISSIFLTLTYAQNNVEDPKVSLETNYGNIVIQLYPETPKHRDNFLKLVKSGFYDGVLFHRVITDFMIQAGDPQSKKAVSGSVLGSGDVGYTIPAEFVYPTYYHKKGALAAARQGDEINPKKASSGCQFYFVQGHVYTNSELNALTKKNERKLVDKAYQILIKGKQSELKKYQSAKNQQKMDSLQSSVIREARLKIEPDSTFKFTDKQRKDYTTIGGTPHLDGEYTVFGEVIEGLDIVDKISKTKTGKNDRPVEDVRIIKASCL